MNYMQMRSNSSELQMQKLVELRMYPINADRNPSEGISDSKEIP